MLCRLLVVVIIAIRVRSPAYGDHAKVRVDTRQLSEMCLLPPADNFGSLIRVQEICRFETTALRLCTLGHIGHENDVPNNATKCSTD